MGAEEGKLVEEVVELEIKVEEVMAEEEQEER